MYRRILFPLDSGSVPDAAAEHVMSLAKVHGAAVVGLRVVPVVSSGEAFFDKIQTEPGSRGAKLREEAQAQFGRLEMLGGRAGVGFSGEVIFSEQPEAEAIAAYAAEHECDLIVMMSRPRTALSRWLMGNVEEKVRRRAQVPVLFVPVGASSDS